MDWEVRRDSPYPLYVQIAEELLSKIETGQLQPGDRIPGERDLAEGAGVSRMTVRQALAFLARQHAIVVKHGDGTYVTEPRLRHDALNLMSFTEQLLERGLEPSSRILEQRLVPAPDYVVVELGLAAGSELFRLLRVRSSSGDPALVESIHIPAELCPGLMDIDLSNSSLYAVLKDRYGLELVRAEQELSPLLVDEHHAELLAIEPGTVATLVEGVTFDARERPVEHFRALYRADRFIFRVHSHRRDARAGASEQSVHISLSR
jgi:GntR family transcriptional regulator